MNRNRPYYLHSADIDIDLPASVKTSVYSLGIGPALDLAESIVAKHNVRVIVSDDRGRNIALIGPDGEYQHLGY